MNSKEKLIKYDSKNNIESDDIEVDDTECPICYEDYTGDSIRTKRKKVSCLKCGFSACKDCLKKVIGSTTQQPHCSKCKVGWNRKFLVKNFNMSWIKWNISETYEGNYYTNN